MASSRKSKSSKAPDVLSAAYLERAGSKNELLRRLSTLTTTLTSLGDELDDPSTHPGLLSLSTALVSPAIISHRDPSVRLHAVLAACELFYIYAPEPPWASEEILEIFGQLTRQLGNLHGCDPTSAQFEKYFRILEQLSEVKIGVVLVDLIRTERGTRHNGKAASAGQGENDALETLIELVHTLLTCTSIDHPPEVAAHAELAVAACIEEFEGSVPIALLEELLTCVGQGPVVWVTNPAFAGGKKRKSPGSSGKKKGRGSACKEEGEEALPPPQIQQTNPSYLVAAKVLRRTEDKISSPIAALLNGLLTGDPNIMDKTSLSTVDAEAVALFSSPKSSKKKKKGANSSEKDESPTLASHLSPNVKSGVNVYSISYELHRIAPQILTTVIGTVSTSLVNTDVTKRWQAAKLLGRLFGARGGDIAGRFVVCFREWLRRSYDPEPKIRETMVKCLVNFLTTQFLETDLCTDVNEALATIIMRDPTLDIRLLGIHQVCDLAHTALVADNDASMVGGSSMLINGTNNGNGTGNANGSSSKRQHPISVISPELLHAIGNRVSSKNKTEHKDAITGLAQIYHKHYIRQKLRFVQEGGEDVSIDEILELWKEQVATQGKKEGKGEATMSLEEEKFAWIPQRVFECVSFSDATDAEMRNRIFQIVDDVLLGTQKSKSKDSNGSTLTPTSRAVGLALIVNAVKEKENAYKWMCTLFSQRSHLQKALGAYLDARSRSKECTSGTPGAFAADGEAMEKLELVASLSAPLPETGKSPGSKADLETILKKVHGAKDKHIFRILSTISLPAHSPSARVRAFDELPKRTKSLGASAQSWVKTLARRCAMGAFLNAESIEHCIILSQECFEAEECEMASVFLEVVKMGTSIFPSLGSTKEGFSNLVEFFDSSRTTVMGASMKKEMEKYGVVTTLSEILARSGSGTTASSRTPSSGKKNKEDFDFDDDDDKKKSSSYDTLREQLLRLCTRDGTPEQARNSVYTISSMIQPQSPQSQAGDHSGDIAAQMVKEKKEFEPLLKALVNPSRLSIPKDDGTNPKTRGRIVSVLSAIAAIAECAPYAFNAEGEGKRLGWGERALEFALDTVLLGKNSRLNASLDEEDGSSDSEDDEELSPLKKGRTSQTAKKRGGKQSKKTNEVSVHCQMLCGAIEVLVSHIRSTIINGRKSNSSEGGKKASAAPKLKPPSPNYIQSVFNTLSKILEDGGIPPSSINGRYCKTTQDQAELRRSAAINLLRLCDANLQLEATYLTPRNWHILTSALLDSDKSVRSSFLEELSCMFTGSGKFRAGTGPRVAPSLRFVSFVTLCADGDGHGGQHSHANAGAANVGVRKSASVKNSATQVIKMLRATCQHVSAQCRLQGRSAEKNFESRLKMKLMPEYCVPYALHLLAFRHETASAAGTLAGENESDDEEAENETKEELLHSQEASQKMLKKRLKLLFDPLIESLGAGADNISFLMRMVELIGKHPPINVLKSFPNSEMSSLEMSLDEDDEDATDHHDVDEAEAAARMKVISQFAREVLLSHVKKDVNLTVYPGSIQFPGDLYSRRNRSSTSPVKYESEEESEEDAPKRKRKAKKSISHYVKKSHDDEMSVDDDSAEDDKSVEEDKLEDSKSVDDKSVDEKSIELQKDNMSGTPNSGNTYEHSPSLSLTASPLASDDEDFNKEFGDVSPIAKADDSPAALGRTAPKGRRKKSSSAALQGKKSRTSADRRKRKSNEIDVLDEFLSPATDGGDSSVPKKQKSTPRASRSSSRKSRATPVSVPKSVMVNVTNSALSSSSSGSAAAAPSQKKRAAKKKSPVSKAAVEETGDFDFSDTSPIKPKKATAAARSRKKSTSAPTEKAAPARKARAPAKAKVTAGKAKVSASKAKVAAGKKTSSRRGKNTPEAASPSTTSETSSRASPVRRGVRRSARAART
mmetsp:Transcript_210/g.393  ORF Transcript_210/g.393 Transcript_210/m.393 type:complete len:1914 (-) Transcript_210:1028-6769(-)